MQYRWLLAFSIFASCRAPSGREVPAPRVAVAAPVEAPITPSLAPADPVPSARPLDDPPGALLHFVGRWGQTKEAMYTCAWSACEVRARFRGTGIRARMSGGWGNRYRVTVDGGPASVFKKSVADEVHTLTSGLAPGEHDITLYRITEGAFGETRIHGFDVEGGELVLSPPPPA